MLLMLALAGGVALLWSRRRWRAGRGVLTTVVVLLAICVLSPLQPALTGLLEDRFPPRPALPAQINGIIILGGAINPYVSAARGQITLNGAAERLLEGVRLAKAHPEAQVLVTGGSADPLRPEPREAPFAASILAQLGIASERLVIEEGSRNTHENAVFSRSLTTVGDGQAWILVTSAWHMPRAVGVFRRAGWPVIPWPVDYSTGGGIDWTNTDVAAVRLYRLTRALHEWIGLAYYRLMGWSDSLFPQP